MRKLKVAVMGLGIGQDHIRAYKALPTCEIAAIGDLNKAHAENVKKDMQLDCPIRSFEEVVADPKIDVINLATFDTQHGEQVQKCLQAKKHVFVEKPLCHTMDELKNILSIWKTAKTHLQSNLVLRSAPLYQWLDKMLSSGEFGETYSIDADYLYGRVEKITEGWRKNEIDYSVFAGGAVHMTDIVLTLLKEKPTHVSAVGNKIVTRNTAFRYADFMSTVFKFKSDVIARVNANFGCVHPHQHFLRLYTTQKTFIHDDAGPRIFNKRGDQERVQKVDLDTLQPSKGALIGPFIEGILNQTDPLSAFYREVDLISVVLAADLAYKNQKEIKVEYLT